MIEIIKEGCELPIPERKYVHECDVCKCEYTYDLTDTYDVELYDFSYLDYTICPWCGSQQIIKFKKFKPKKHKK